jgi:CRP/FNR family cyclic AMP-dependent transcriptional regulator
LANKGREVVVSETGGQVRGLQVLDRKVFAASEKIFREGDSGGRAYIIQRGTVDIVKDIDGENIVVGSVGPGGIFGEMALIDDEPRMASAVAREYCVCIIVTSTVFQTKLNALDPFLAGVLRILVENIRSIQNAKQDSQAIEAMFEGVDEDPEDSSDSSPGEVHLSNAEGKAFEIA